jgi:hypothetical protein
MSNIARALALLSSLLFVGCASLDRSEPPPVDAPLLTPIAAHPPASITLMDRMRPELVWYDPSHDRVARLVDGSIVNVQEREVQAELHAVPTQLRVFDDASMIVVAGGTLYLLPADGSAAVSIEVPIAAQIDGLSIEDFWVGGWALDPLPGTTDDYGACHYVARTFERCVTFPNIGGYDGLLAVASDGSVYMNDRDVDLYRWDGTSLVMVGSAGDSFYTGFRRSGTSLIVLTQYAGTFRIEGESLTRLTNDRAYLADFAGSADDFWFTTYDSQSVHVDPNCRDGLLRRCETRTLWSQLVVHHTVDGVTRDAGYENCTEAMEGACSFGASALGVDGDHAVVLGTAIRRTN